jgi:hypothetical protein
MFTLLTHVTGSTESLCCKYNNKNKLYEFIIWVNACCCSCMYIVTLYEYIVHTYAMNNFITLFYFHTEKSRYNVVFVMSKHLEKGCTTVFSSNYFITFLILLFTFVCYIGFWCEKPTEFNKKQSLKLRTINQRKCGTLWLFIM